MKTMTTPPENMQPTKRIRHAKPFKARTLHYNTQPIKNTFSATKETDPNTGFTVYKKEPLAAPWQSYRNEDEFDAWRGDKLTDNWRPTVNSTKLDRRWLQEATQLPYEDTFLFSLGVQGFEEYFHIAEEPFPVRRYNPTSLYLQFLAMEPTHLRRMVRKDLVFVKTDRVNRHNQYIWTCNGVEQNGPDTWKPDVMELCNAQQVLEALTPTYEERRKRLHHWLANTEGYRLLTQHVDERSFQLPYHMVQDTHHQINTLAAVYLADQFTNVLVEQAALGVVLNFVQQLENFATNAMVVARNGTYKRCYTDARFVVMLFETGRLQLLNRVEPPSPFCTPIK